MHCLCDNIQLLPLSSTNLSKQNLQALVAEGHYRDVELLLNQLTIFTKDMLRVEFALHIPDTWDDHKRIRLWLETIGFKERSFDSFDYTGNSVGLHSKPNH